MASIIFMSCFISGAAFCATKNIDRGMTRLSEEVVYGAVAVVNETNKDLFEYIFSEGYKTDDCENYVRRKFHNMLAFYFQVFIPICEAAKNIESTISLEDFMKQHDWDSLSQKLTIKINREDVPTTYLSKIARKYWRESRDDHLEDYFTKYTQTICKVIKDISLQEYIVDIVRQCCIEGGAFWKNDILDALILCNLQEENTIVTFDKGAISHMEKHRFDREMYDLSLKTITMLK